MVLGLNISWQVAITAVLVAGIVWGIISYTAIKAGRENFKDISVTMVYLSLIYL
ncbi:MAG: hypothetical protein WB014_00450 [Methanosarcina sp.]